MQYRKIALKNKENNTGDILKKLLELKGLKKEEEIEAFLNPKSSDFISPFAFCDMQKACKRIFSAIEKQEKILIWGDFDCDGVTSSAILFKALKELITHIAKEKVKLVITVDCGISNISEVNLLKGLKVDTIITDHHSTDTELPSTYAIINPQVKGAIKDDLSVEDITSLTYNSGSIVAYKLAMALLENNENQRLKEELLVIASCGAIADVVPLLGENRSIVAMGLKILNENQYNSSKGIYKLLSRNLNDKKITSYDIAFILAPRINAVGRLANAQLSFDFLMSDNDEELNIIIEKLDNYNLIRQSKCSEVYDDIISYLEKNKQEKKNEAIILINDSWHIGVIGIVAAHIVEEFNKPCFLMTIDENNFARCSIRSNEKINVYQVLKENQELFSGFGGHKLAGGCSFDLNKISFEKVKEALLKTIKETSSEDKKENVLLADIEIKQNELNLELIEKINKLEPFGQNNEMPICAMFDVEFIDFKLIGKEQNHLKAIFEKQGLKIDAIKWREENILVPKNTKCDIAFYPRINKFNDIETVQIELIDVFSPNLNIQKNDENIKIYDHRLKKGILEQINDYLKKDDLDIAVWAKSISVKEKLAKYDNIQKSIIQNKETKNGLMFFDYPSSQDEFVEIITTIKPQKIHFMHYEIDENIENYIKQINGMIKFCANKLNGKIDLNRFAQALGVSENFIQIILEILENIESIKILDIDKIEYLKGFIYEEFKNNAMFEILKEEFNSIVNYKKEFLESSISDIEKIIIEKLV